MLRALTRNLLAYLLTYLKDCRVQIKQKRNEKQSYKTLPLLLETEATLMFLYFW